MKMLRDIIKRSGVIRVFQDASAPLARTLPLEKWPFWFSKLQQIRAPSAVPHLDRPTGTCAANINIIFAMLERVRDVPGDIAEAGVYQGATILAVAMHVKRHRIPKAVFAIDSFEGFDDSVLFDIGLPKAADAQHRVGGFSDTSYDRVRARAAALGVTEQLKIVPGRFSDVFRTWNQRPFSFAHLDCDLHDSYQDCLHYFYPRMSPGGVILFDEYDDAAWPGCNLAVDAFLADKPEKLQTIEMNNHIKAYVVKLPRGR